MVKQNKKSALSILVCLVFLLSVFGGMSSAQEKTNDADTEKLYKEIAGKYEFDYQGQIFAFVVSLKDGNLLGAPEGEVAELLEPAEDEDMKFIGYDPDGREHQFKFARDEDGKLTKCTITVPEMGIVVDGEKVIVKVIF